MFQSSEPTLMARNPFSAPSSERWSAHSIARAMSATLISGRHGVPSLRTAISWPATAQATKSLSTRSSRRRGLNPQAVE